MTTKCLGVYLLIGGSYCSGLFTALLLRIYIVLASSAGLLKLCCTWFLFRFLHFVLLVIVFWFVSWDSPNKYVFSLFLNWLMFSLSLISTVNLLYSLGALYWKDLSPLLRFVPGSKSLCRSLAYLTVTLVSSLKGIKYSFNYRFTKL